MDVFTMGNLRIIDLTKLLDPETETRRCHLFRFNTGGRIPDFHTIMDLTSHLGTHVECPYHHNDAWKDVSAMPLDAFVGRALYLNFEDLPRNAYITPEALEKATAGKLHEGDIVLLDSPHKCPPFTPLTNTEKDGRLFVNRETAQWLCDHKVKCVGFGDGVSVESNNTDICAFHDVLMEKDITFLEVLKNLDLLHKDVFFMSFAPMYIRGLDSCPVRAYAIEGLAEFS